MIGDLLKRPACLNPETRMKRYVLMVLLTAAIPAGMPVAAASAAGARIEDRVDWAEYLGRQDMVWNGFPRQWEEGAFLGNGQLGAMIHRESSTNTVNWIIGRSDVAFNAFRIPIGTLGLKCAGAWKGGTMRVDLWNAEARGVLRTDAGEWQFRSFTHSDQMVQVIEVTASEGEKVVWEWEPGLAANTRKLARREKLSDADQNEPPVRSAEGDIQISFQPLKPAGGHATAWKTVASDAASVTFLSVGYSTRDEASARAEAVAAVKKAAEAGVESLTRTHRAWWHEFWPASFVSIPDARLESFYWIQIYKMASGTRPGRPALDLMGPWFRLTPWPKIWWNLNLQLTYWPQLTGNRLELGQSLCELIDNGAANLAANAKPFEADSAAVGRATGYDCIGPMGGKTWGEELCNLPWAMHNYWLQYRYSMDDAMLKNRLFPMLKRSINFYLHLLKEGPDGRLHIPGGLSPEYEGQPSPNPDCNIDLALLRWGCQTLLSICERLKISDPQIPQWKSTLEKLVPYPQDENGLRISASVPFARSHRHYSHLLMIYPLYIMTPEQPENRELVVTSLKHWMGMPGALQGYSYTGAASISALLGEGDDALRYLNKLLDSRIPPNTLYMEAGPCIETPLSAAASLNDMLLSSWGDRIRVFPGAPAAWKDVVFHNLRAEGAFLVSASRRDGRTQWVRIRSLAGEPCRIRPGLAGEVKSTVPMKPAGDGAYDLRLAKGEEAILYVGERPQALVVAPVDTDPKKQNAWGQKK